LSSGIYCSLEDTAHLSIALALPVTETAKKMKAMVDASPNLHDAHVAHNDDTGWVSFLRCSPFWWWKTKVTASNAAGLIYADAGRVGIHGMSMQVASRIVRINIKTGYEFIGKL